MKKLKNNIFLIIAGIFLLIALSFGLYPSVSNYINQKLAQSTIKEYSEKVDTLNPASKDEYIKEAQEYNDNLASSPQGLSFDTMDGNDGYNDILSFDDSIIGYIEIPAIDVYLPIFHGTKEGALEKGAIHVPNSAFPVGGIGNHTVLAAHTAYANQIFFDYIPNLVKGDEIYIKILGDTYTYKVIDTAIIDPLDLTLLQPNRNKELLTLLTCFPYAQNTHRYIVTAERVKPITEKAKTTDAVEHQKSSEATTSEDENSSYHTAALI
ncbi:MAG: class C sortase [Acutalibacteraceae bacterium]|nr:class C sortase [Acutalibacteraceae bacterium]